MDPEDNIQLPIIAVNLITAHILMSAHPQDTFSRKLDQLRKSTAQDNQLTRLSHYINTGFPCEKKNLPTDLQEYWNYRDTLSDGFINNCLMSLNAFSASSGHLNFLDFFCKLYIGISNLLKSGRNEERKLTMPQKALVCFNVLGESKFQIALHLSLRGV